MLYFFGGRNSPVGAQAASMVKYLYHTQLDTHTHTRTHVLKLGGTHLGDRSASRGDLYMTTHTTLTRNKHPSPGRIRTRNPSKREAAELRLRPLGHVDRLLVNYNV